MTVISEISNAFGIRQTPWVIRAYVALLFACAALMIFAMAQSGNSAPNGPASQVLSLAIDSFKTVLGAVIGALSMAASQQWNGQNSVGGQGPGGNPPQATDGG
jgi:hypothetical protein